MLSNYNYCYDSDFLTGKDEDDERKEERITTS